MRNESASNCSNSRLSTPNNLPCTCNTHTKPKEFGTFLHPTYMAEFQRTNIPCDCECEKCVKINWRLLSKDKVAHAKKRILKSIRRINERTKAVEEKTDSDMTTGDTKIVISNSLSKIDNLCALKLVLLSNDDFIFSQRKSFDKVSRDFINFLQIFVYLALIN